MADGLRGADQPPATPFHLLTQQLLALILQEGGIGRATWWQWLERLPAFQEVPDADREAIAWHLLEQGILHEDQGILSMGLKGEAEYGYRHFSELLSVFTAAPVFTVFHGQKEIGTVDPGNFLEKSDAPKVLALGGRSWRVVHIDWRVRRAFVEPDPASGRTRWSGGGAAGLGFQLCQKMQEILSGEAPIDGLSRRAVEGLRQLRDEFAWAARDATVLRVSPEGAGSEWWTFGGLQANRVLLAGLTGEAAGFGAADDFMVSVPVPVEELLEKLHLLEASAPDWGGIELDEESQDALKFAELLPSSLRRKVLLARWVPGDSVQAILNRRRVVSSG